MNGRERFVRTVERKSVDRPAAWLGLPTDEAVPGLLAHFGVESMRALKATLGDDVWAAEVPFDDPPANHIACAFNFAQGTSGDYEERTLTAPGFFAGKRDPRTVRDFAWPDPNDHMDAQSCRKAVYDAPEDCAVMGILWSAHFQDACAAFGMEDALMALVTAPDMFRAVIDRITEFYLQANEIFLEATRERLDAVLIGNDLGAQTGLMLSPQLIRDHVLPGTKLLVDQARRYGVKVVHHSCGAIRPIIDDLIAVGVDVIHPMQALAVGMEPQGLRRDFGDRVSFCGGIDAQHLLVSGTPGDMRAKVAELMDLFPTGLVISPSHEAILPDTKPENIEALFDTLGALE
jgi:uroporphyrinogen decarboxylase